MDKRYRQLERTLKLASLKKENSKSDLSWVLPNSCSISSINGDTSDAGTNGHCLRSSGNASEVVSSSSNMKNMFWKRSSDDRKIATSSVKNFDKENSTLNENVMMPPPQIGKVARSSKKSYDNSRCNKSSYSDIERESPKKHLQENRILCNSDVGTPSCFHSAQMDSTNSKSRRIRIFRNWTVVLSIDGKLLIRGLLECGTLARSKPVIRRFTSMTLQSACKHLYYLEGHIADEDSELPDYIRGKFYNGFPHDWENVHQIWRTFVQQRCPKNFHWPTPITDSDDDLKSVMTDSTFSSENKMADLDSSEDSSTSPVKGASNVLKPLKRRKVVPEKYEKNDSFTQTNSFDIRGTAFHRNVSVQTMDSNNMQNSKENIDINSSDLSDDSYNLRKKLNTILTNLSRESCPNEKISKFIEMLDCFSYLVSYGSFEERESTGENVHIEHNKRVSQNNVLQECSQKKNITLQSTTCDKVENCDSTFKKKRSFSEMNGDSNSSASDNESEIYAGVPKISMERIIRQREKTTHSYKRMKKKMNHPKHYVSEIQLPSDKPTISSSYATASNPPNVNSTLLNDSSISIISDQKTNLPAGRHFKSDIPLNDDKYIEQDLEHKRGCFKEKNLDDQMESESRHETQEHLTQDNTRTVPHPARYACEHCHTVKYDANENIAPEKTYIEGSSIKRKNDTNDHYPNNLSCQEVERHSSSSKETRNKSAKPVVTSSITVDSFISNMQGKYVMERHSRTQNEERDNKDGRDEKGCNPMEQREACTKSNAVTKSNASSTTESQQFSHKKETEPNRRKSSPRKSPQTFAVSQNDELVSSNRLKQLSSWTPKLSYEKGLHLVFVGNLLNEAGHIECKKYQTDIVARRISPKIIETVNHERYQLLGDMNNTKRAIPKELLTQCRHGCPTRIDQFCKAWQVLQNADGNYHSNAAEKQNDNSIVRANVSLSSKGRRIIPPLSYWTGERIILKGNETVYSPGTAQQSKNASRKSTSDETEETIVSPAKKSLNRVTNEKMKDKEQTSRNLATKTRKRTSQEELTSMDNEKDTLTSEHASNRGMGLIPNSPARRSNAKSMSKNYNEAPSAMSQTVSPRRV